jgi:hypothetical protein
MRKEKMMTWTKVKVAAMVGVLVVIGVVGVAVFHAAGGVVTRTYDLSELVQAGTDEATAAKLAEMQDLIVAEVEPESWGQEGPGSIRQVGGTTLEITQTSRAHKQVAQFIAEEGTRRVLQVKVDVRCIAVEKQKLPAELLDPATKQLRTGNIDAKQAEKLVQIAESSLLATQIVVPDGQEAKANVSTDRNYAILQATTRPDGSMEYKPKVETVSEGVWVKLSANIAKDRKTVRLMLFPTVTKLLKMEMLEFKPQGKDEPPMHYQSPMTQTVDLAVDIVIADGQYVCLGGQTLAQEEGKGKAESVLVILVKPTITTGSTRDGGRGTGAIGGGR